MATNLWQGGAVAVNQVQTWTFAGTWTISDTITITVGNQSWTYAIASATIATFLASLLAALDALSGSVYPAIVGSGEIVWTNPTGSTLVGTAGTAGKPFTVTISTDSAGGTINGSTSSTGTATTASSGPADWSTAANWSTGLVPVGACAAPVQANPSATSGGSLANGTTYYWVITATNPNGETVVSNEKSLAITSPNQTADLSWAQVTNATGYKVYRSTTSGTYGATSLVTTITSGSTVTYNDAGAATTTGQPPASNGAVGDTVYLSQEGTLIKWGLDQHGVVLTALYATAQSLTLGLPKTNADSANAPYAEYRTDFLKIQSPVVYVNSKTRRFKLDLGSGTATTYQQDASGRGIETNVPAVLLKGTNAGNVWSIFGGEVGMAFFASDSLVASTLRANNNATVTCGVGCTLDTVQNEGASITVNGSVATLLTHPAGTNGTTTVYGTGSCAQLSIYGGLVDWRSNGDFSTGGSASITDGMLTCDNDQRTKSISHSIQLYGAGAFMDNYMSCGTITLVDNRSTKIRLGLGSSYSIVRTPI